MTDGIPTILALEAAVFGGSVSLLRGSSLLGYRTGQSGVSRAEDILSDIESLLAQTGISRADINILATSVGPGSYTGIRIGLSIALGLTRSLRVGLLGTSIIEAISLISPSNNPKLCIVPQGRGAFCIQFLTVEKENVERLRIVRDSELLEIIRSLRGTEIIAPDGILPEGIANFPEQIIHRTDRNLSYFVGLAAFRRFRIKDPIPIFAADE